MMNTAPLTDMTIKTSALDGRPVAGYRVRVWVWADDDGWYVECPCLLVNGRRFKSGAWDSRDTAMRAGLHALWSHVTDLKNANAPCPWIVGDPKPKDRAVEERVYVVS